MLRFRLVVLVCCAVGMAPGGVRADFSELARRVPARANAIVLIDVEKVLASPAAVREDWKGNLERANEQGITILPQGADRVILASQLDVEFMTPLWQVEMLEMHAPVDLSIVAEKTGGALDQVGLLRAVRLLQDAHLVQFDEQVFGIMKPANRQSVSVWVRDVTRRPVHELSGYLAEAYDFARSGSPIIMAVDLEQAFSEAEVQATLREEWEESGFAGKAEPIAVGQVLSSIRGVTLGITLRDVPFGKLKIDFEKDPKPLAGIAKPLFLEILDRRGMTIAEFEEWEFQVDQDSVTLEGHFTDSGLRRIFSIFDRADALESATKEAPKTTAVNSQTPEQDMGAATLAYYQQVKQILKDLKHRPSQNTSYTTGSIAKWLTNYGRKINNLSLLNVDPEMIEFGTNVAMTLSQAGQVLTTGNIQGSIAARNTGGNPYYYNGDYANGWGYRGSTYGNRADARVTTAERANVKANVRGQSAQMTRQVLSNIDALAAEIRVKMVQKYQLDF